MDKQKYLFYTALWERPWTWLLTPIFSIHPMHFRLVSFFSSSSHVLLASEDFAWPTTAPWRRQAPLQIFFINELIYLLADRQISQDSRLSGQLIVCKISLRPTPLGAPPRRPSSSAAAWTQVSSPARNFNESFIKATFSNHSPSPLWSKDTIWHHLRGSTLISTLQLFSKRQRQLLFLTLQRRRQLTCELHSVEVLVRLVFVGANSSPRLNPVGWNFISSTTSFLRFIQLHLRVCERRVYLQPASLSVPVSDQLLPLGLVKGPSRNKGWQCNVPSYRPPRNPDYQRVTHFQGLSDRGWRLSAAA